MTSTIQENVNGVRVVKAFNKEVDEINKFKKKSRAYVEESLKVNTGMAYYWGLGDGLCQLQFTITIFYCIYLAEFTNVSVGDIVVCVSYISMLIYPIRNLGRIISDFGKSIVAAKRIEDVLSQPDEYVNDGTKEIKVNGNIVFDNVYFKFDDASNTLLNGVSFDIKEGETVAIVGKTGCGKSTIASILVRMQEYTSGSIKVDGIECFNADKLEYAHVDEVTLFPGLCRWAYEDSVRENLDYEEELFAEKRNKLNIEVNLLSDIIHFKSVVHKIIVISTKINRKNR